MNVARQAQGMNKIKDYVYCCGGITNGSDLDSCERFCLLKRKWTEDVPKFKTPKFSLTMIVVDNTWLYSFGGSSINQ